MKNKQELISHILSEKNRLQLSIMDIIIHISETTGLEIEAIADQVRSSHKIKEEIRKEAICLRMLKQ